MHGTLPARPDPLRRPAMACGSLLALALLVAAFGPKATLPDIGGGAAATETLALRFQDGPDGSVTALDAATDEAIARIAVGEGGFVRSTMRGLAGERKRRGVSGTTPFDLARYPNGSLVLTDPETGKTITLNAFGATNAGAFAAFFDHGREPR